MEIVAFYKSYQQYGGQEKVIYELTNYLADKGYKITIFSYKIRSEPKNKSITLKKVFIPPLPTFLKVLIFALYAYYKTKRLKRKNPDICVFGFGKTFYQDIYRCGGGVHKYYFKRATLKYKSRFGRFLYRLKKYLSLNHWVTIFIEELTFRNSQLKHIIVPSEFVKQQIIENFKVNANKITIIRNGVSFDRFSPPKSKDKVRAQFGLKNSENVLCFISTNHKLKGLQYLLEAVSLLKKEGYKFKLLIAGSGNCKFFHKLAKKLKICDTVIFLGKRRDVEKIYQASDYFVYPTLFDTSALVILEAMACACIPISSIYAGSTELIKDGVNGYTIKDPTDVVEIKEKIKVALKNKTENPLLTENALKTVYHYASVIDVFTELEKIIIQNCKQQGRN